MTAAPVLADTARWACRFTIAKFHEDEVGPDAVPYEVVETDNMVMYGGISAMWEALIGNGTASAGQALTYFNNANAAIGVGDSTTAEAATHTNLQAASNKLRKGMNVGFPAHTDGTVVGAATITFQASFTGAEANFAWQELGIFNSATDGVGRMLNRKVQNLGVKASGTWQVTGTVTINP